MLQQENFGDFFRDLTSLPFYSKNRKYLIFMKKFSLNCVLCLLASHLLAEPADVKHDINIGNAKKHDTDVENVSTERNIEGANAPKVEIPHAIVNACTYSNDPISKFSSSEIKAWKSLKKAIQDRTFAATQKKGVKVEITPKLLNGYSHKKKSLAHYAAKYGDSAFFDFAVPKGINLNFQDEKGNTPLHTAVSRGNLAMSEYLLSLGTSPNVQNKKGETPLHVAIQDNNIEIVAHLIRYGASASIRDNNKFDAYVTACSLKSPNIAALLLICKSIQEKEGLVIQKNNPKNQNILTPSF